MVCEQHRLPCLLSGLEEQQSRLRNSEVTGPGFLLSQGLLSAPAPWVFEM